MPPAIIPAATLILFREGSGAPEHLFVERAATMAFAGGATVFPGGRVDDADRAFARTFDHIELDDAAGRIAALRETVEETGLVVGASSLVHADQAARLREALHAGTSFRRALDDEQITITLDGLIPFARWCPNFHETRNFDTRFYIARAPVTDIVLTADARESAHLFWATAQHVLDETAAERLRIIFPTRRNLERLAALGDYHQCLDQATRIAPDQITPVIEIIDGESFLTIPADRGYPITRERLETAKRA